MTTASGSTHISKILTQIFQHSKSLDFIKYLHHHCQHTPP